jgi:hypothetical protein
VRFDIEDEAEQFVLSFGGDLEVIEPAETIGEGHRWGTRHAG